MKASVLINDVEVDAEKVLGWLKKAETSTPAASAGLATVLGALDTAITSGASAAAGGGLNLALDEQTLANVKAVWPDIKSFVATLGIKL